MNPNRKLFRSVTAALGILLATAVSAEAANQNRIVKPGEEFAGKTYNELISEWSNWFGKEPIATHPAFDPDGRYCDLNQHGKVWFLARSYDGIPNRTCEIPAGKAIFISLASYLSFGPEFPTAGDPCEQMATPLERVRCDVNDDLPLAPDVVLEVTLDGQPIRDLFAYRTQSVPGGFTLRVPNPSFITDLGFPPGDRFPAAADGYFLLLKPLKPGVHTLNLRHTNGAEPTNGVNYTLIIEEGDDD